MTRRPVGATYRWNHERLQRAMKKAGLDENGLHQELVRRNLKVRTRLLIAGELVPHVETAREIAAILGVDLEYLLPKEKRA